MSGDDDLLELINIGLLQQAAHAEEMNYAALSFDDAGGCRNLAM
jgi:hypothetical protein